MTRLRRLTGALLLLLLCASCALAADPPCTLTVEWTVEDQTISIGSMEALRLNCLFLPGCLPAEATLRAPAGSLSINGRTHADGELLDLTPYLGQTVTIGAPGFRDSEVLVLRGSVLPAMFITMPASDYDEFQHRSKTGLTGDTTLLVIEADGSISYADALTDMRIRGNSTRHQPKRPFQIKLKKKADFGGMGKAKTWLLLANWFDVSLLRNQITYDLARETGIIYTPECRQTDLYLNGLYNGTYLLTEKIQLSEERLDITNLEDATEALNDQPLDSFERKRMKIDGITQLRYFPIPEEPEDVTGGFLLEMEKGLSFENNKEEGGFSTEDGLFVVVKEPSQVGERAAKYIAALVGRFHHTLCNTKTTDYRSYIDLPSFIAKFWIEEFTMNFDAVAGSQFLYKDSDAVDPLLHAGPCWDYDLSYGNREDAPTNPLTLDYLLNRSSYKRNIWRLLWLHEDFRPEATAYFREVTLPALRVLTGEAQPAPGSRLRSVREYADAIADSANMNFYRWNALAVENLYKASGRNFPDAAAYLQTWVQQRTDALAEAWAK